MVRRATHTFAFGLGIFIGWTASIIVAFALSKSIDKAVLKTQPVEDQHAVQELVHQYR